MNRLHFDRSYFTTTCAVALAAFGVGAAIMYILDPESGRRRRAYARDKTLEAADDVVDTVKDTARGLRNRAQNTVAEVGETARSLRNRAQDTATEVKGVLSSNQPTSGQ
jgi:hypothetical protein